MEKDLARPEAAAEIHRELSRAGIHIDVLVNNAGFGLLGAFGYSDREEELHMLQLNVVTLVDLTKLLLPAMLLKRQGRILNVASTAGFQPGPYMANYYATKAYVVSFSVALSEEVRERGITVSTLCPGPTPTGFRARAGIRRSMMGGLGVVDSRVVARIGFEGLMAGKLVIIPGILNRLGALVAKHAPMGVVSRILGRLQQRRMA
jgi:short-subunit dehydrogenase